MNEVSIANPWLLDLEFQRNGAVGVQPSPLWLRGSHHPSRSGGSNRDQWETGEKFVFSVRESCQRYQLLSKYKPENRK